MAVIDARLRDAAPAELADAWFERVHGMPDRAALRLLAQMRERADAAEAVIVARSVAANGDTRSARRQLGGRNTMTERERSVRAQRAKVVAGTPQIGQLLSSGDLSVEHVDRLAAADRTTDGAASADPQLVADLVGVDADGARKVVDDWKRVRLTAAEVSQRHHAQRAARRAWRHQTGDGLPALTVAGDQASIDRAWSQITDGADRAYRSAGGRDRPPTDHETGCHRRFDAALALLTVRHAATGTGRSRAPAKPAAVVLITVDHALSADALSADAAAFGAELGTDPTAASLPDLVGTGPITNDTALRILEGHSELWTLLADPRGQPLWLGRSTRQPSRAQLIALICRDKGCAETGAPWQQCDIHHSTAWTAPGQGPTDIDNLVLVQPPLHRDAHRTGQTWAYNQESGRWAKRPAHLHEQASCRDGSSSALRPPSGQSVFARGTPRRSAAPEQDPP